MAPASQGLLGRIQQANDTAAHRFGPHTAEVEAFIAATAELTPWQWRQALATRRLVASVSKEGLGTPESARSIQAAIRSSETRISETLARAGEVLFDTLIRKGEDKQVAAWQAMTALVHRSQLPAMKFAVNYTPFATLIPLAGSDVIDPRTRRYMAALDKLTKEQLQVLARRWRVSPATSHALLQAVAKNREAKSEEAVALVAFALIPNHLTGDEGWAAVKTAVHGGRVLGALAELSAQEVTELWAPIEAVIPLASLDEVPEPMAPSDRVMAAVDTAIKTITRPPRVRTATTNPPPAKAAAAYGSNHTEVAAFIKGVAELSPIQWLRVLDRRKLVSSVTREGAAEPAGVVRAILAAIEATRDLDTFTRCRVFVAVERVAFAIESHHPQNIEQVRPMLDTFDSSISLGNINGGGFAHRVAALQRADWERVAAAAPQLNEEAVAPVVNAGSALIDFFGGRSDDEAVATWHAVSALVHRHHLTPIKFAASYAPFASAIPVTNPRSLGAMVSRYVTAVGRLGSAQCAVLAKPWQLEDDLSNVLSRAIADGSSRSGEEAAALAAVVTVPMRMAGGGGWAAVKTAAFGGRVIAARTRLTAEQLEALWAPVQAAIPLASLSAPARARR
ncbi:MAG TPA: hypothetical protein VFL27_13655 [Candidatus Dormibacteraeota bacterium]|nr:hypothetical protein [Candidatus Dormibacteraeota bacterium]